MKKVLFGFLLGLIAISCSRTPEEKANTIIKEDLNKVLLHIDTYDPVETVLDSAYAPLDSPEFFDLMMQMADLGFETEECDMKIKSAKSKMALWSSSYMTSFSRNEYNEAKEEYDKYKNRKESLTKDVKEVVEKIKQLTQQEPKFIGYKAKHSYRVNNNSGNVVFGHEIYLLDKDITKVITSYNMDDEKTEALITLIDEMKKKK